MVHIKIYCHIYHQYIHSKTESLVSYEVHSYKAWGPKTKVENLYNNIHNNHCFIEYRVLYIQETTGKNFATQCSDTLTDKYIFSKTHSIFPHIQCQCEV